jgi:hypothetical protein
MSDGWRTSGLNFSTKKKISVPASCRTPIPRLSIPSQSLQRPWRPLSHFNNATLCYAAQDTPPPQVAGPHHNSYNKIEEFAMIYERARQGTARICLSPEVSVALNKWHVRVTWATECERRERGLEMGHAVVCGCNSQVQWYFGPTQLCYKQFVFVL